nr:YetF domain-containing protein [uncultured Dyadobacter sp.]
MKKEDTYFGDWLRMFVGDVPGGFYWEVVLKIIVIYLILMISMRLMGKRMASQLSRNEMISMVSLAAAIGVPLQAPDRGILAAVVIAAVVILIQQLVALIAIRNQRAESITQGDLTVLVSDGCLNLENMKQTGITKERAFAQLRSEGIRHLGQVKRLYFEASGALTLIPEVRAQPGLAVLPDYDKAFISRVCSATGEQVCSTCGSAAGRAHPALCLQCGSNKFDNAMI